MGLNRWLGCIENPRTGREAERRRSAPAARRAPRRCWSSAPGRPGCRRRSPRPRNGHRVDGVRAASAEPGGQVRLAASVPNRAELGDMVRNQLAECRRLGVDDRVRRRRRGPACVDRARPDHVIVATGAEPAAAVVGARRRRPTSSTCATCSTARRSPSGDVVVIDEIGFHHATSVAELLADRGCAVEVVTQRAWSSARTSASRSTWRTGGCGPTAKGIVQSTDLVPMGIDGTHAARCCTTRPARRATRTPGLGRARRAGRSRSSGCTTTCKARRRRASSASATASRPRRAHAAVVEGERAGAHVPVRAGRAEVARGRVART